MTGDAAQIPFRPNPPEFEGWPMPPSVPAGMRLELDRAKLLDGREASFDNWMQMLHDRYDECVATLAQERVAVEATFLNQEADGSWWMYHFTLASADSPGLVLDNDLDQAHFEAARQTKHRGWEALQPRFFLCPDAVREAITEAGRAPSESAE